MIDSLWQKLAEQVPVVVVFVIFVVILFKEFIKEIARKDVAFSDRIGSLIQAGEKSETIRDDKFIKSLDELTGAHVKALAKLELSISRKRGA
jgi:hypothetical protein